MQTFHLAHLALHLCEQLDPRGLAAVPAVSAATPAAPAPPYYMHTMGAPPTDVPRDVRLELRRLTHEVVALLGLFSLRPRAGAGADLCNSEILRWRWGEHPIMLYRRPSRLVSATTPH